MLKVEGVHSRRWGTAPADSWQGQQATLGARCVPGSRRNKTSTHLRRIRTLGRNREFAMVAVRSLS
jgi:hypothetical protein